MNLINALGGRKNVNGYVAVGLVILWMIMGWPAEFLTLAVGFLGLTNISLVGSDFANRNKVETVVKTQTTEEVKTEPQN